MSIDRERFEAFFRPARLETRDGGFVADVWLMPFALPAEIVRWGERVFTLHIMGGPRDVPIYREAFMTFAVDPNTGQIA